MDRNNSVVKWEDFDAAGELLLIHVSGGKFFHFIENKSHYLFLICEVDAQWEDCRLETVRDQSSKLVPQPFL